MLHHDVDSLLYFDAILMLNHDVVAVIYIKVNLIKLYHDKSHSNKETINYSQ